MLLDDDRWLAWTRDRAIDVTDRGQLLDGLAVGLSVLCWRNTCLEDVHADTERSKALSAAAADRGDAAGPMILADRADGSGIPNEVMMRLNIATAVQVRQRLDHTLPDTITQPGIIVGYPARSVPEHVTAVVDLLHDPDRHMSIGATSVSAGDVLGSRWDQYINDVLDQVSIHVRCCDVLGVQRALWYTALSGIMYASAWYPNPWWTRAVTQLRSAVEDGRVADVYNEPDQTVETIRIDEAFWTTLAQDPATLTGTQCAWLQATRLRHHIDTVREGDRQRYGPLPDTERFSTIPIF